MRKGKPILAATALTCDPQLWPLEHDYYVQPDLNRFEWDRHEAHDCDKAWHPDCGDPTCFDCHDPAHPRPNCPELWHWLEVAFDLSDDLIAEHTSGNWLALADWKVDVDVAIDARGPQTRRIVQDLWEGRTITQIAGRYFDGSIRATINELKAISSAVRAATRVQGFTSRMGRTSTHALQGPGAAA